VLGANPVQSATVYTTNPTKNGLGSDPDLHVERSAINPLSRGMVLQCIHSTCIIMELLMWIKLAVTIGICREHALNGPLVTSIWRVLRLRAKK